MSRQVLILGAGSGLGASLALRFRAGGYDVSLASRNIGNLSPIASETGATCYSCDASEPTSIDKLFEDLHADHRLPDTVVYNVGAYSRGRIESLDTETVERMLRVNALGAFVTAKHAALHMLNAGGGTMLFTGATAGVKGFAQSAPFAMGKFALRGLCQSLARELAPKNIHVTHFVIDGLIHSEKRGDPYTNADRTLSPGAIADAYFFAAEQDKSAWTDEITLRPYTETY